MADNKFNIPLEDANKTTNPEDLSIGNLVKNTLQDSSDLLRSEVSLIKAEVSKQVTRVGISVGLFITALIFILYSSYFLLTSFAIGLGNLTYNWLGYLIVFIIILVLAILFIVLGIIFIRKIEKPNKSIESIKESSKAFKGSKN